MKYTYFLKRLLLIPITLLGIIALNFAIVQMAPGGPVEQMMMKIEGTAVSATTRVGGSGGDTITAGNDSLYRGGKGLREELRQELEKRFGFDKPAWERFVLMIKNYLRFDFGTSFYQDKTVISLILEKLPVSISLGVFSTLLIYLIAIPLGIKNRCLTTWRQPNKWIVVALYQNFFQKASLF